MDDRANNADDEGVLRPEDLSVDAEDAVTEIGENRYLVSTDEGPSSGGGAPDASSDHGVGGAGSGADTGGAAGADHSDDFEPPAPSSEPRREDPLASTRHQYGIAISAKTERGVSHATTASNNIVEVFEDVLVWYARQVDENTPPEEVLAILLDESDLDLAD